MSGCSAGWTAVRLGLEFADGLFITFGSAARGSSLQLGFRPLRAHDLGEHGRIEIRHEGFPCDVLRPGASIRSVTPLDHDLDAGVRIQAGHASVYVYALGQQLLIEHEPPPSAAVHGATGDSSSV